MFILIHIMLRIMAASLLLCFIAIAVWAIWGIGDCLWYWWHYKQPEWKMRRNAKRMYKDFKRRNRW